MQHYNPYAQYGYGSTFRAGRSGLTRGQVMTAYGPRLYGVNGPFDSLSFNVPEDIAPLVAADALKKSFDGYVNTQRLVFGLGGLATGALAGYLLFKR